MSSKCHLPTITPTSPPWPRVRLFSTRYLLWPCIAADELLDRRTRDMLMALCHSRESGWRQVESPEDVSELRKEGNLLWGEADVRHLETGDVELIAEEFDLHPLAVE